MTFSGKFPHTFLCQEFEPPNIRQEQIKELYDLGKCTMKINNIVKVLSEIFKVCF